MTHVSLCLSLEDRFLAALSSQSSTSSTHLQLPTPPEVMPEQPVGGPSELDAASISEGTVCYFYCTSPRREKHSKCFDTMLSYPLEFKHFILTESRSALLGIAFYNSPSSVAVFDR